MKKKETTEEQTKTSPKQTDEKLIQEANDPNSEGKKPSTEKARKHQEENPGTQNTG